MKMHEKIKSVKTQIPNCTRPPNRQYHFAVKRHRMKMKHHSCFCCLTLYCEHKDFIAEAIYNCMQRTAFLPYILATYTSNDGLDVL